MTLCFSNSKSLIQRHNYYFKVSLLYFSSLAVVRPDLSNTKVFMSKKKFLTIQQIVNAINKKIQSSNNGLSQNPILRTNPHYQDYCLNSLVIDSDLLTTVINYISHEPRMVLRIFKWAEGQKGFRHSEVLFCSVLDSLVQNGFMDAAFRVVEKVVSLEMHSVTDVLNDGYLKDRVSCQILDMFLRVYVKRCNVDRCLDVFSKMLTSGLLPDVKSCNRILRFLRDWSLGEKAMEVYDLMGRYGIRATIVTYNTMLDLYCKKGSERGKDDLVGYLDEEMRTKGFRPDEVTYNVFINKWLKRGEFEKAKKLIAEMERSGALPTVSTYNTLMHGLCKQGRVDYAKQWISVMVKKNLGLDIISYNILIHGYCLLGDMSEALFLLCDMKKRNLKPSAVTYNTIIDGFSRTKDLERACNLKDEMIMLGIPPDVFTYTILVNGSYRMGNAMIAKHFYDEMLSKGLEPDRIACISFIVREFKLRVKSVIVLQEEILSKELPLHMTYNIQVRGISSQADLKKSCQLLRSMNAYEVKPDHYTSIIHAHLEMGYFEEARNLFDEMLSKDVKPTVVTYTILIHACAGKRTGKEIHACVRKERIELVLKYFRQMQDKGIFPNVVTYNALINCLCKLKKMDLVYRCLDEMPCKPNKYTYTILISQNNDLGDWQEVLRLYNEMLDRGIEPDSYTHCALFKFLKRDYVSLALRDLKRVISDDRNTV